MTDIEIIKALELCIRGDFGDCKKCPLYDEETCKYDLKCCSLYLINRQKAELEELTAEVETLQLNNDSLRMAGNSLKMHYEKANAEIERLQIQVNRLKKYDDEQDIRLHARLTATARAEAIKEVLERIESKSQYTTDKIGKLQKIVYVEDIDKVKTEMIRE